MIRRYAVVALTALALLVHPSIAAAQSGAPESTGINYIPAYVVVALAIGLGGYLFTLPSNRDEYENLGPNVRVGSGIKGEDFHEKED